MSEGYMRTVRREEHDARDAGDEHGGEACNGEETCNGNARTTTQVVDAMCGRGGGVGSGSVGVCVCSAYMSSSNDIDIERGSGAVSKQTDKTRAAGERVKRARRDGGGGGGSGQGATASASGGAGGTTQGVSGGNRGADGGVGVEEGAGATSGGGTGAKGPVWDEHRYVTVNVAKRAKKKGARDPGRAEMSPAMAKAAKLVDEPTTEMVAVMEMAQTTAVLVVAEHGLNEERMADLGMCLGGVGRRSRGATAIKGASGGDAAGVMVIWDEALYTEVEWHVHEEGRVVEVCLRDRAEVEVSVFGVYMPNRQHTSAKGCWERLEAVLYERGRFMVGGDLNAGTARALQREGRLSVRTAADRALQEMLRDGLVRVVSVDEEGTYDKAGTAVDYWLASPSVAGEVIPGLVMPGVADHRAVEVYRRVRNVGREGSAAEERLRVDMSWMAGEGKQAAQRREEVEKNTAALWADEWAMLPVPGTRDGVMYQWNKLQQDLMRVVEAVVEEAKEKWYDPVRDGEGGAGAGAAACAKGEGRARDKGKARAERRGLEKLRAQAGWWASMRRRAARMPARAYEGDVTETGMGRVKALAKILKNAKRLPAEQVRLAVVEKCEKMERQAEKAYKRANRARTGGMMSELRAAAYSRGSTLVKIFDALRKAKTGVQRSGASEAVAEVFRGDKAEVEVGGERVPGELVKDPSAVKVEVASAMARQSDERRGFMAALDTLLRIDGGRAAAGGQTEEEMVAWLEDNYTREAHDRAVAKAGPAVGTGRDDFNAYTMRLACAAMQTRYFELLRWMTVRREFPMEFHEWECVLAKKPRDDPRLIHRRRDLWLVPHAQKIVARVVGEAYDRTDAEVVMGSQGGWTAERDAPAMHVPLTIQKEICYERAVGLYRGFVDMGQFFPTIVREVQYRVEQEMGVAPAVTAVMRALQQGATGSTVTAHGRTPSWALELGVGQGCVNAPRRAKLQVTVIQRAVSALCEGFDFACDMPGAEGGSIPQLFFADDGAFMADTLSGLQLAMDACWWVTRVLGLKMIIKKKEKTAWQGKCCVNGVWQDVRGYDMKLPNGEEVPQLLGGEEYVHLGFEEGTDAMGRHASVRAKVVKRCRQAVGMIAGLRGLSLEQLREAITLSVEGVIGYYGRGVPMRKVDCESIEVEIRDAVAVRGWGGGAGLYAWHPKEGGMGFGRVRGVAAAAYLDEFRRILNGGDGEPARRALEHRIAQVAWKLGCRTDPVEWMPAHLSGTLGEDDMVETWYALKLEQGVRTRRTGAKWEGPLDAAAWAAMRRGEGAMIWEGRRAAKTFVRQLAGRGAATLRDIYDGEGGIMTWAAARSEFELTATARVGYEAMRRELIEQAEVREWCEKARAAGQVRRTASSGERMKEWEVEEVVAARRTAENVGGWEYLVEWRGGERTWEPAVHLARKGGGMQLAMRTAREARRLPCSHYERMRDRVEGGGMTAEDYETAVRGKKVEAMAEGEEAGGRYAGFVAVKEERMGTRGDARALFVYELVGVRGGPGGQCVGTQLMAEAVRGAGARVEEVHLIVRADATQQGRARELYKRLGFKEKAGRARRVADRVPAEEGPDREEYWWAPRAVVEERARALLEGATPLRMEREAGWAPTRNGRAAKAAYEMVHSAEDGDKAEWKVDHEVEAVHIHARGGSEAARVEGVVLDAVEDFIEHAGRVAINRRGPANNMEEATEAGGRKWCTWELPRPRRQVVYLGEAAKSEREGGAGGEKGGKEKRRPSVAKAVGQEEQLGVADGSEVWEERLRERWLWRAVDWKDERSASILPGYTELDAMECAAMREDRVGRLLLRPTQLEGGSSVEVNGVGVRLDRHEEKLVRAEGAVAHNKRLGAVLVQVDEWGAGPGDADVMVAVDGSAEGEGVERRTGYGMYYGMGEPEVPTHRQQWGETNEDMATCLQRGMKGGRLPGEYDSEYAEMYAIYRALRDVVDGPVDARGLKVVVISDALSMLQSIEATYWRGSSRGLSSGRRERYWTTCVDT